MTLFLDMLFALIIIITEFKHGLQNHPDTYINENFY